MNDVFLYITDGQVGPAKNQGGCGGENNAHVDGAVTSIGRVYAASVGVGFASCVQRVAFHEVFEAATDGLSADWCEDNTSNWGIYSFHGSCAGTFSLQTIPATPFAQSCSRLQ